MVTMSESPRKDRLDGLIMELLAWRCIAWATPTGSASGAAPTIKLRCPSPDYSCPITKACSSRDLRSLMTNIP
jgi:hypothetical protein